jgi:cytochrome c1
MSTLTWRPGSARRSSATAVAASALRSTSLTASTQRTLRDSTSRPSIRSKDNFTKYQDGTGSLEQNAKDFAAFAAWASDPTLNTRKSTGLIVMLYLLITTLLLYFAKRNLWAKVH